VQSADRALAILVSFTEQRRELGVGELAGDLGLHKSTVSRLLSTLEGRGLVRRAGERFAPGHELIRLGNLALDERALADLLQEPLAALARATGETVNLAVRQGDLALNVHQIDGVHLVGVRDWTGHALPLHCTANGKALLAFGDEPLPAALPARTEWTLTEADELEEHLELARGRGFAVALEELELGLHAVAAPVFDVRDRCVAAVSVSAPAYRLPESRIPELGVESARAAAEASRRLGRKQAA
jgi:DNA-binding IclR family transcriptional regulator